MLNKLFLIVIYHFSLVKAAVKAAPVCKFHNGVNKMPQFLLFSMAKGGTKNITHLSIADGRIILKTVCASIFNEDLSNEPNFGWIHLARQYL